MNEWRETELRIGDVEKLLNEGYEIEVDSPDGWVGVNFFIHKGMYEEFVLQLDDGSEPIRCNAEHLFETAVGWVSAHQLLRVDSANFLTRNGYVKGSVRRTGEIIPIVDINVDHENHRYYTESVSSHNTGVGKSLFMCHCAAGNLLDGKNVLYITLEMAEERIAERIDSNLLDVTIDELAVMPFDAFQKKIARVKNKTTGKLIIKEYPTSSAGSANFRHLLNELKLKKNFIPDIIYIDYINICASSRVKYTANVNSYTYVKAIAEELRGLAVEFNVPIVTATQTTRSGYCLDPNTLVMTKSRGTITIDQVLVGDLVLSNNGWNEVKTVFPKVKKKMFCITTKGGKQIIASEDHLFPTEDGEKNIKNGLCLKDRLFINK